VSFILGANLENLTLTGTGNINATGNALNNVLTGNAFTNVLDGKGGTDTMLGGAGDDTYVLDKAAELGLITENPGEGSDTLRISYAVSTPTTINLNDASLQNIENVTLIGGGAFSVTGNGLDNVLTGNAAANTLAGGGGADTLNGAAGADSMSGGTGDDTYFVDNAGDQVIENPGEGTSDTVRSSIGFDLSLKGANVENLTLLGVGAINGTGNELANVITGNAGANVLDGKGGADAMSGGAGNDTYLVDNAGDTVSEAPAGGVDVVKSSVNFTLADNVENLILTGTDSINGTGNLLHNVLTGNAGNNVLDDGGVGAPDSMIGGAGNDTYVVNNAGDVVSETLAGVAGGVDLVQSAVSFILGANLENLTLTGTGNINATGNALNNTLIGNSGNNTLKGGVGADILQGGDGDDRFIFDPTDTQVSGGVGNDTLKFTGGGQHLDLSGTAGTVYTGLEAIDLTGIGNNSLSLTEQNVVDMSSTTDALTVNGNAGDSISSVEQGWVQGLDQTIGGILYHNYTSGAATLHVQDHVTANLS